MVLFCKNTPVYNIDTGEVYSKRLLPGYMQKCPCAETFKSWLKLRYSSNTNSVARQLKGIVFGQGNRVIIDKTTRALSLSDCYWIKSLDDKVKFEEISPYYTPFWTGGSAYVGQSVPTLYVKGSLSKQWVSSKVLEKYGNGLGVEVEAFTLCKLCGIPVNEVWSTNGGVAVWNFTSPKYMLEQLDQSGMVDPNNFSETDIMQLFGLRGVQMIVIDAILGNRDRHAGNIGWLRDADTGEYVCMSPLYDFDHALDSRSSSDRLTTDAVKAIIGSNNASYVKEAVRVCLTVMCNNVVNTLSNASVYKNRAVEMYTRLTSQK